MGNEAPPPTDPKPDANPSDWRSTIIPEDLADHASLKDFKDPQSLVKSYVHTKAELGKRFSVPTTDAGDEAWDEVYTKLGRPEAADKYDFSAIENKDMVKDDDPVLNQFKEVFHKAGLNNRQAAMILNAAYDQEKSIQGAIEESRKQAETALRKEYGQEYENRVKLANQTLDNLAKDAGIEVSALREELSKPSPAINSPLLVRLFSGLGKSLENDRMWAAGRERNTGVPSRSEARYEIERLTSEHFTELMDPSNPKGREIQARLDKLYLIAHGEEEPAEI